MEVAQQVVEQIRRENKIRQEERIRMIRFFLNSIIDPDGEAAKDWRANFSLIEKSTVSFLEKELELEVKNVR